ncbi:COX15/CtaA family protein [Rhodoluna limnophila]|uniref:COX15/CtaA family protein n=1 Tax=Rhodoluna limnophila TaxID=232537 RepID=UPI001FE6DE2C|nr:COX15/CtaA family protein [Rhodoluna limnophila]
MFTKIRDTIANNPLFSAARLPLYVWLSLVSQILIVVTGGVVRLTGSGLGCPTWPKCTEDSLITVPEMGWHGVIEFANRLLTFVLALIALLTFVVIVRLGRKLNRGLFAPALILGLGIPAQAVLGGFTVWSQLNPWFVGAHFVLSAIMIAIASLLVFRALPPVHVAAPRSLWLTATPVAVVGAISVIIGVLVTGAGPHSGDAESIRNGLDLELWQHLHSYPAYVLILLVIAQAWILWKRDRWSKNFQTKAVLWLLVVLIGQAAIGVAQARLGVPPLLVGLHMLGAAVICSMLTFQWLAIRGKSRGSN